MATSGGSNQLTFQRLFLSSSSGFWCQYHLVWLSAEKDFIEFCCCEIFKTTVQMLFVTYRSHHSMLRSVI